MMMIIARFDNKEYWKMQTEQKVRVLEHYVRTYVSKLVRGRDIRAKATVIN